MGEREATRAGYERAAAGRVASVERQKTEEVDHWVQCVLFLPFSLAPFFPI